MADKKIFLNSGVHKADNPQSTHDLSHANHLTCQIGKLIPVLCQEMAGGSYVNIKPNMDWDLMPMVFPLQSRVTAHLSVFSVPMRILMKNFTDFISGVGDHVMPYIQRKEWVNQGSLADYMGLPTNHVDYTSTTVQFNGRLLGRMNTQTFNNFLQNPIHENFSISDIANATLAPYVLEFRLDGAKTIDSDTVSFFLNTQSLLLNGSAAFVVRFNRPRVTYKILSTTYNSSSQSLVDVDGNSFTGRRVTFTDLNSTVLNIINSQIDRYEDMRFYVLLSSSTNAPMFPVDGSGLLGTASLKEPSNDYDISLSETLRHRYVGYMQYVSNVYFFGVKDPFDYHSDTGKIPIPVNALPFRAYEFIYNYYFRNRQIDPFKIDGVEQANNFLTFDGDGADFKTPVDLKNCLYEYDFLTTCLKNPQLGNAPLVGVTTNDEDFETTLRLVPRTADDQPDYENAYDVGVQFNKETGAAVAVSNYSEVADKTSVQRLTELIKYGISINDLRNVSAFQRYLEKMQRTASQYENFMLEFYGMRPPTGENFPVYQGGYERTISISKVQSQAPSVDSQGNNLPLGYFAGTGSHRDNGDAPNFRFFLSEPSYVIALVWFSVTPIYSQLLPKHFLKNDKLDFFNPIFNNIGPQPVYKKEIAPLQLTDETLDDVFGYQRPWYEYIQSVDECHGEFRSSMRDYLMQRFFFTVPDLDKSFIEVREEDISNVFSYQIADDKIFGCIYFDEKVTNQVAKVSIPKIMV